MSVKSNKKELTELEKFAKNFPFVMLGFEHSKQTGQQLIGDCVFCGKENKLHINLDNGLWDCKAGDCLKSGNPYTFVQDVYEKALEQNNEKKLKELANERSLSFDVLKEFGVVWNESIDCWMIPVKNKRGIVVNLKLYIKGKPAMSLAGMKLHLGNADGITSGAGEIFICEGEWDGFAAFELLINAEEDSEVSWVPGANTFKEVWVEDFSGKDVVLVGDNDIAGLKFRSKVGNLLWGAAKSIRYVEWDKNLAKGYDLRDAKIEGKTLTDIRKIIKPYEYDNSVETKKNDSKQNEEKEVKYEKLDLSKRPKFKEVIQTFKKWMKVNDDFELGVRIVCAVHYATQLRSIPLWIHFVSPPGSGKTEILLSCHKATCCRLLSKVTATGLVSGFSLPGGRDPSIIPTLFGKTLIIKDYTEIIQMNKVQKEEVDSIFRGAYDGSVTKQFGNGITRRYEGYFNMITGVTQELFGESRSSLGERYLIYHMIKGTGHNVDDVILSALGNSGDEIQMKEELADMMKAFLEWDLSEVEIPDLPEEFKKRIVALSQVVSMLRAHVARDRHENPLYAPQIEVGTRLAKQLKLLLQGLALCNDDLKPSERDYEDVVRVAIDTCKGFNFSIATYVVENAGANVKEMSESMGIPTTTVRGILSDMKMLGVVYDIDEEDKEGQGRKNKMYYLSDFAERQWNLAGLSKIIEPITVDEAVPKRSNKVRVKFRRKK